MSVLNPRKRLVNFRLSDVEFERLKTACGKRGARSISDFARTSVLESIEEPQETPNPPFTRTPGMEQKVAELEIRLNQLLQLMSAGSLGASPNGARAGLLPAPKEYQRY